MKKLRDFHNIHKGKTAIVCGLGPSLKDLRDKDKKRNITIGVNDIGRHFTPDYLVCLEIPNSLGEDREKYVIDSEAKHVFSQFDIELTKSQLVKVELGNNGNPDLDNLDTLDHSNNSPYVAICLAALMGFNKIGVIGVDITDDHQLMPYLETADNDYRVLENLCWKKNIYITNLSNISKINAFIHGSI